MRTAIGARVSIDGGFTLQNDMSMHRPSSLKIGWIGAGRMGTPMAKNLLHKGYRVAAYDIDATKVAAIVAAGGHAAASVEELCADSDLLVSMVFDDRALLSVADQIATSGKPGQIYVDMSTVSLAASIETAGRLASTGIEYLRAPVSGTVKVAETAQLSVYVSGSQFAFAACRPILEALSGCQMYVGQADEARTVKLLINMILHASTVVMGEALVIGDRLGMDRGLLVDAINQSAVGSGHYRVRSEQFKKPESTPPADLSLTIKDLDLALSAAGHCNAFVPVVTLVRQFMALADNRGFSNKGVMGLVELTDELNRRRS